ncbi:MAG: CNP1-like family protein [Gammaproteobacteria bacterium]|nr:CNP1-like family protein [Gammaproteobacteria bacterium]
MNIDLKIAASGILPACKILALYGAVLLLSFSTTAAADVWDRVDGFSDEYQENEGVEEFIWKEGSNNLPDYPQDNNLLQFDGPPAYRNYQYLMDEKSLIVGQDGVVRYSIVIRSSGGADNVMYDGLRCTTNQIKNYAYGSTDMDGKKKFIRKKNADWKAFRSTGVTAYASILAADYFCDHNGAVLKRHEIIQNIKYGKGNVDGLYY